DELLKFQAGDSPSIKIFDNGLWILADGSAAGSRWDFISGDKTLIDKMERVTRLADMVRSVREAMKTGNESAKLYQSAASAVLETYKSDYGEYPANDRDVLRFVKKHPAVKGVYDAFITPSSEVLASENIYAAGAEIVDGHNPAVRALEELQKDLIPASDENIRARFPADAENLIGEMYANKDIFYTPKGLWRLREDFISGDAWRKIDALREAAAGVDDGVLKEKLLYGASELEKAAGWTPVEEADFSPRSAWIDELIIQQWVSGGDALDNGELADLAKNPEGKWGVMDGGVWTEYNHPLVYYLNGQRQRSKNIDTKAFNEEHDELFKAYISNHDGFRQSIERKYNRLFKTNLTAPVKTYPVEIKGWRGADAGGKTLKPHQWQTIHHLYRQGAGISALGTGFGKTASAIGLMSLLRQEGKSSRVWLQVPNNKVKDWAAEIKDVMPSLKIASIDPEESGYSSRGKRYARYWEIANSRADVIIMPESAASEIQLKKDNDYLIREKIAGDYKTEKRIAGASKRLTAKAELKALSDTQNGKTNRIINFEDFGCDALFVDEAHNYKNLFSSSLSRETGLNDGRQSAKAMALFKKADFIRENNDGKNVFLLTATPLTNSPLEYYNMLQYIAGGELKRFGVCSIDGFIKEFADVKEGMKYDWTKNKAGWGKILAGFKNLQTLQDLFFKYTDLQNDPRAAGIEKPEPRNTPNLIPSDDAQVSVLKAVSAEIERYRSMDKDEREIEFPGQNFLTFYSQMRTASLDLEMFDPDAYKGWKNPKLEALSFNVKNIYDDAKGGQVVFCDRIFDSDARFNLHDKIKSALVERGFKDDEIVIINGFTKSGDKRADGAVERDVSKAVEGFNSGKYKVIIGTTACIGEGVNLQKNSAAVHHFDIPFRPSDFIQRNGRVDRQGNAQDKVELHTYLATGTIDNYSAALVQNKANWIDKLLRTKSNVFTNPDDENAVDMNELLLSLTEEWGDSEKAASMREELRRQKEDAERAAWDKKMRSNIKSLSLLRCALQSLKNKDSNDYKNRIDKIHNLERALSGNPLFTKHDIIGNTEPFLYNAKYDVIIREGDILFRNDLEIVAGFDFKKQSFSVSSFRNPSEKNKYPVSQIVPLEENNKLSYRERVYNPLKFNFARPSDVQKKLLLSLNDAAAFYDLPDKNAVKDYYKYHLLCFSSWRSDKSSEPPVFNVDNDGKLSVGYARYSVNDGNGFVDALNPFDPNDMQKLLAAARRGLNLNYSEHDALYSLSKKYFPDLHAALIPRFKALDDVSINKKIIDDYRDSGFDSASQDVAVNQKVVDDYSDRSFASPSYSGSYSASRNENIVSKENQEMETIQNLNDQAGETAGRSFSPDVLADTAAKYHAEHGASEWRSPDGGLRLYFNFAAKKNLYGLSTYSQTDLSPEKTVEYRRLYRSAKLPQFPEKALQNGRPVSPEKAFEILCSTPYYDVNQKKMFGLLPDVQTKIDYLKQRSLDMGGKEYIDADKGRHRIYFQSPTAVKNLYGLETKGKTVLNEEKEAAMRKKFPFVKYLPVMPEAASLRGEPVDPQRAFDMLASRPYFDVNSGKFELFSKEKTFDMFFEKEFNKDGVSDERRSELLGLSAEHDARVKINVKEAAVFAAEMKTAPSLKDMSQAQQLKVFFQSAVENNNAPWDRQFGASAAFPPFNFESGRNFSRSNLVSASLHMAHIGSKDPRYLTEDKIQKAGLAVDDNAAPLKIAYRVQDRDGSYKSKTTVYYNAKNIAGLPPLVLPKSINELSSQPIAPERAANANDQITNNIAGFIAAMSSNRAFQPLASGVKQENYKELLAAPVSDLFSKINAASSKAAELSLDKKELQLERGGRAAGMDM
ncbi:MAG: DEAD/DEAH box helicase family protein, partial [Spirochaetaceae bacterium]|nr:DEAD/DEAH box helicase family protein [Spirochaetaceae bacterium]